MHLPHSNGFNYIVQGCCSLTHYPEFCMLQKENAQALGEWILQDILCRWGTLIKIISDNIKPFIAALGYLERKYHVKHICISRYNSHINGIVIQQALFKAADGDQGCWSQAVHSVFWLECFTPQRRMGCAPYYAVTGTHPLLLFDIIEANYLLPPPDSLLTSTELITRRTVALQKHTEDLDRLRAHVHQEHNRVPACFERDHAANIENYNFKSGDLVLVQNMAIEKALNRKIQPRYTGPLEVVSHNRRGAYILCELNGTLLHAPYTAFHIILYFTHEHIDVPDIQNHIDITVARLREMEDTMDQDPKDPVPMPTDSPNTHRADTED